MPERPLTALLRSFPLLTAIAFCPGCIKAVAQLEAERVAAHTNAESGCGFALRQWFSTLASTSRPGETNRLSIPDTLRGQWWRGFHAIATWSDDGKLRQIVVARQPWEPFIVIGPLNATPDSLGLKQRQGEFPVFYTKVTNGIFAQAPYYH